MDLPNTSNQGAVNQSAYLTADSNLFHYDRAGSLLIGNEPLRPKRTLAESRTQFSGQAVDEAENDTSSGRTLHDSGSENILSPAFKAEFVDHLVAQYFTAHPGASGTPSQRPSHEVSFYATSSQQARGTGRGSFRRIAPRKDDEETQDDHPEPTSQTDETDCNGRLLACPYYKWKPLTHKNCQGRALKEISRLKQHLWRCHDIPVHCPVCFHQFPDGQERDAHVRTRGCELRDKPVWDCINAEQKAKIKRRVDPKKSKSELWFDIFKVLFPDYPLPQTPWVEILLSTELLSLRNFIAYNYQDIFDARVEQRIPYHLRVHTQEIAEFSHQVFEDTVATLLERFELAGRSSDTPTIDSSGASGEISRVWSGSIHDGASIPTTIPSTSGEVVIASPTPFSAHDDPVFQDFSQSDVGAINDFTMALDDSMEHGYDAFSAQIDNLELFGDDGMALDNNDIFFDCL